MTTKSIAIPLLVVFSSSVLAQRPYEIPFTSSGNTIELTIANTSTVPAHNIRVEASNTPSWLRFSQTSQSFERLNAGSETLATFTLAVDQSAPVGIVQKLRFIVSNSSGESWAKEIDVSVGPPVRFEISQNFPNPFNPSTTISYQLPINSNVTLSVYDILGREVAVLVDGAQVAGYHQATLNASSLSSGVYIYSLEYTDGLGHRPVLRKTMMLVK